MIKTVIYTTFQYRLEYLNPTPHTVPNMDGILWSIISIYSGFRTTSNGGLDRGLRGNISLLQILRL